MSKLLSSGFKIPTIGLGTIFYEVRTDPEVVEKIISFALNKVGYTHLDCAWIYENEKVIGQTLSSMNIDRSSIFVTGKLWNEFHDPSKVRESCLQTLNDLKLKYLDLYLMHWPLKKDASGKMIIESNESLNETWKAMEALVDDGLVKSIGVCNFNISRLQNIIDNSRIKPCMNQVEMHPYLPQHELLDFCLKNGVAVTAYSPLGSDPKSGVLSNEKVLEIAKNKSCTPAQVLLAWGLTRGTIVIPKSSNFERIQENYDSMNIVLDDKDMKELNELYKTFGKRVIDPKSFWGVEIFD